MTTPLINTTITSPGMYGLNKQTSASIMEPEWATEMTNCVLDRYGRIASRQGWINQTLEPLGSGKSIDQLFEYIDDRGRSEIIFASGNRLYKDINHPVDITGDVIVSNNHWKFQNFNGKVVGWQAEHNPIIYDFGSSSFKNLTPSSGTIPKGDEVLSAYGRLWALDETGTVLHYSDLLIPDVWFDATDPGSAGVIDLKSVWVYGMDRAVSLASFNGFLLIFGQDSILVYANPQVPNEMELVENLRSIGCISRDSVQHVGDDIMFLSSSGVRSLGRVIQEKSMPMGDETKNVRSYLLTLVNQEDPRNIKSLYSEKEGFYLLSLPRSNRVMCIDVRVRLPDASRRITEWTGITPSSLIVTQNQEILVGKNGVVGLYGGFLDGEETYRLYYYSGWLPISEESRLVFLKMLHSIVSAGSNTAITYKWTFDYKDAFKSKTVLLVSGAVSEYNESEYGEDEYSGDYDLFDTKVPGSGTGTLIKVGFEADVQNSEVSLQQFGLQARIGRIY